jgi:hypothetical protein
MNRSQLFSNTTMTELVQSYLTRNGLEKECTDLNKDVYHLIRKLLTEYSKELFDFFSFQFDSYIKHHYYDASQEKICCVRTKIMPSVHSSSISSSLSSPVENKDDEIFMRRPTAYSIYCNELRKNVIDYKSLRPQNLWRQLSIEEKEVFEERSRQSQPLPWTRKKRFKSDYGRYTLQQQPPTRFIPDEKQIQDDLIEQQQEDLNISFEMDEDFYQQQLQDKRYVKTEPKRIRYSPPKDTQGYPDVRFMQESSSDSDSESNSDSDLEII